MSNVIPFKPRVRKIDHHGDVIRKVVNGEVIECMNLDALTPAQFSKYFSEQEEAGAP